MFDFESWGILCLGSLRVRRPCMVLHLIRSHLSQVPGFASVLEGDNPGLVHRGQGDGDHP